MVSEAFSNYTHRLSKDKKEQLFDFYMLVGLQKPSNPKLRAAYDESLKVITRDLRKELLSMEVPIPLKDYYEYRT